jgi:hypothetical protein
MLIGQSHASLGLEGFEGHAFEGFQVAQAEETLARGQFNILLPANTDSHFTKIGMSHRQVLAYISNPAADLTVGVSGLALAKGVLNA